MKKPPRPHDIALEIVRRARLLNRHDAGLPGRVLLLDDPPSSIQQLQLIAAALEGTPIVVGPRRLMTTDEWAAQYCASDTL
jgi:hypothetical protein